MPNVSDLHVPHRRIKFEEKKYMTWADSRLTINVMLWCYSLQHASMSQQILQGNDVYLDFVTHRKIKPLKE